MTRARLMFPIVVLALAVSLGVRIAADETSSAASDASPRTRSAGTSAVATRDAGPSPHDRRRRRRARTHLDDGPTSNSTHSHGTDGQAGAAEPELPTWTVEVVDGAGHPVHGAWISAPGGGARTDTAGRAHLSNPELDEAGFEVRLRELRIDEQVVHGELTRIVVPRILPVSVGLIDGSTGRTLAASGRVRAKHHGEPVPDPDDRRRVLLQHAPVVPGGDVDLDFDVDPPPGFTHDLGSDATDVDEDVSRLATRVHVDLVLRPAARLRLRVVDSEGRPAQGAVVHTALTPKRYLAAHGRTDADGRIDVSPLPRMPSIPVRVEVQCDDRYADTGWLPLADLPTDVVELRLPPEPTAPVAPPQRSFNGGCGCGSRRPPERGPGTLVLDVLRRCGRPAAGVDVVVGRHTGRTDERGRVRLEGLPTKRMQVRARELGFLPTLEQVTVQARGVTRSTVEEDDGHPIRLLVVDTVGRPLPWARVDLADGGDGFTCVSPTGTQRATEYTDAAGRLLLPHAPSGINRIQVRYGGERVTESVGWRECDVELVLTTEPPDPADVTPGEERPGE